MDKCVCVVSGVPCMCIRINIVYDFECKYTQASGMHVAKVYEDETVIVFIHLSLHKIPFIVSTLKEISRIVSPNPPNISHYVTVSGARDCMCLCVYVWYVVCSHCVLSPIPIYPLLLPRAEL